MQDPEAVQHLFGRVALSDAAFDERRREGGDVFFRSRGERVVGDQIKETGSHDTDESDDVFRRFNQRSPNFGNINLSKHKILAVKRARNSLS